MTVRQIKAKPVSRKALRLDLRRALFALCGALGVAGLVFLLAGQKSQTQTTDQGYVFGRDFRIGEIVVMPLVGENCRQIKFDNDNGALAEGDPASCAEIMARAAKFPKKSSHVEAVSENFRK